MDLQKCLWIFNLYRAAIYHKPQSYSRHSSNTL